MLIGICGGICAGKHTVLQYLVEKHNFQVLSIDRDGLEPGVAEPAVRIDAPQAGPRPEYSFANVGALLDYVTTHWQKDFVTSSIHNESVADALARRPFFILIHVDAPISVRWQRFRARHERQEQTRQVLPPPSLETFVLRDDEHMYAPGRSQLVALAAHAQIKLLNASTSITQLHARLAALDLPDPRRLRPSWDQYFMTLASLAARRSNCMRRQVGCVLVREQRVMSTGYNGTPRHIRNCNEGGCPRCNGVAGGGSAGGVDLSTCLCLHAEENALLEAGRERIGAGAVLYCNTCPCLTCTVKIVQVGITEVVYSQSYHMDAASAKIFAEAGVRMRQFSPPREGLVNLIEDGRALAEAAEAAAAVAEGG